MSDSPRPIGLFKQAAVGQPALCALVSLLAFVPVAAFVIDGLQGFDWLNSGYDDMRRACLALLCLAVSAFWARLAWRGWRRR